MVIIVLLSFETSMSPVDMKTLRWLALVLRLIKPLAQVLAIEADEIDDGLRRDTNRLALLQIECEADISRKLTLPLHNIIHAHAPIGSFRSVISYLKGQ